MLDEKQRKKAQKRILPVVEGLLYGPTVLLFAPIRREVDIWPLVEETVAHYGAVVLPRCVGDELVLHRVTDLDRDLEPGRFGIREPMETTEIVPPARIDVAVVPAMAYDRQGNRLGRGAGFYDRLLAQLRDDARVIGVGYSVQLLDAVPVDTHDRPVNVVVTDRHTVWR